MSPPVYAVLGGTGATGSEIIKHLFSRNGAVHLNIYARSASKLNAIHPGIDKASNVTLFIGDMNDIDLLASCLRDTTAVLCTVAQNENEPGCSISQRVARNIVLALEQLRRESPSPETYKSQPLIFPSSAILNPAFEHRVSKLTRAIGLRAGSHVLGDLRLAAEYLQPFDWIPISYWQPGPIVKDQARGVELTLDEGFDLISFADVAQGIIDIVERDEGQWIGKQVGFRATGKDVKPLPPSTLIWLISGLTGHYFPSGWRFVRRRGWW